MPRNRHKLCPRYRRKKKKGIVVEPVGHYNPPQILLWSLYPTISYSSNCIYCQTTLRLAQLSPGVDCSGNRVQGVTAIIRGATQRLLDSLKQLFDPKWLRDKAGCARSKRLLNQIGINLRTHQHDFGFRAFLMGDL